MIAMYVSICVHFNPYHVASCSPRPSFFGTMTDVGTHALLKKWADAVALRTVHRGVYSPDSTHTVSWASLENCAWSTLDTPVALVKVTQPAGSILLPLFSIIIVPHAVTCLWTYGRIGGHTMMVRRGPHGGFLMGGMIWPICKGWMPWGNLTTESKSLRQRAGCP